jgi:hypothetical protein
MIMTFPRSQGFRSPSAAKFNQLQLLLTIRLCQKMKDLRLTAVVDEVPAAREEAGEEGFAERDGDIVEETLMEIVVAGVVSDSP